MEQVLSCFPPDKRSVRVSAVKGSEYNNFTLCFSSEKQCGRFLKRCNDGGFKPRYQEIHKAESTIKWEYVMENGRKVVLGRGGSAHVYKGINMEDKSSIAIKEFRACTGSNQVMREVEIANQQFVQELCE